MTYHNITNLTGIDIKGRIVDAVKRGLDIYQKECNRKTRFQEPIIGFANTSQIIFDLFDDHGVCRLPRRVYNPARAVIVYFLPYAEEITESNQMGSQPSEQWIQAYHDSTWAIMKVNAGIVEEINRFGRLAAICNSPSDWNEDKCGPEWNFKIAAYAAELGVFGPNGCIVTEKGYAGRFGAILTDINLVPKKSCGFSNTESRADTKEMAEEYERYLRACYFEGECSEEIIHVCPGNAITKDGIDRKACQEYCKKIFSHVPTPDVCGKCYGLPKR